MNKEELELLIEAVQGEIKYIMVYIYGHTVDYSSIDEKICPVKLLAYRNVLKKLEKELEEIK